MSVLESIPHAIADGPHERRLGLRWWLLIGATCTVLLLGYLVSAGLIALVTATATSAEFNPVVVLLAALPGWLALHQSALTITGAPMSVLPLLPTAAVMLMIAAASAWVARRSRLRRPDQAWPVIATMGLVHAFAGAAIALVLAGPFRAVPVDAFLSCGLTATAASAAGVANRCGLIYLVWERVEAEVWSGLRIGLLALAAVVAGGGVVLLVGICASAPEMVASMSRFDGAGDAIGTSLLSLLYLPNGVLAGWAFAAGTGLSLGELTVQPLHIAPGPGPVPDLPLLAVLPSQAGVSWSVVALALPLAVGVLVGLACRRVQGSATRRLLSVGVAACTAALGTLVLAYVAGGDLGGGAFSPVTLRPLALAAATMCWIAVPAAAVTWFAGPVVFEDPEPAPGAAESTDAAAQAADAPEADSAPPDAEASEDPAEDSPDEADSTEQSTSDGEAEPAEDALDPEEAEPAIPHAREPLAPSSTRTARSEIDPSEFDGDVDESWAPDDESRGTAGTRNGNEARSD
ncbi:DUF6350 family protein [Saccharopolyspora hirsuta]|uniref:Uncharacterized protein n=1 Tax=Saccharopolyspora hirsuta TaxID=1837 RepID=A0A5M7BUU6_SACHI|nr:DUF6350 family protein [Saccharopolyspora hirsuta]KAA5833552.1 hypothetical protein F1721_14850 [Saccharopolyspora hirsuta]